MINYITHGVHVGSPEIFRANAFRYVENSCKFSQKKRVQKSSGCFNVDTEIFMCRHPSDGSNEWKSLSVSTEHIK